MPEQPTKVDLATPDLSADKRSAFDAMFPGVLADGVLDAGRLGELLDTPVSAPPDGPERFGLMWAGKQDAVRSLLTPSRGTLVPAIDESIDFDTAENVFIEGDNLEVLKLLQKAYNDKVKLIYIDPPYNTGDDFIYNDDFADGLRGYLEYTGQLDESGNRVAASVDRAGRRHSRWLSMMYPRLVLARNLLAMDGAIFVSIDFNEVHSLRLLMDEVFGEENFQREIIWRIGWLSGYKTAANNFIRNHDTMLFYTRNPSNSGFVKKYIANANFKPLVKKNAQVTEKLASLGLDRAEQKELLEFINHENRPERYPLEDTWNSNEYDDLNSIAIVSFSGEKISKVLDIDEEFKGQKSIKMLQRIVESTTVEDDLVLDFFAGSGSTAHAVMAQNAADGGRRRCISVNLQERLPEDSAAVAAGYAHVSDIGRARIRKAMEAVPNAMELGLRVLRLDRSNFRGSEDGYTADLFNLSDSTLLDGELDEDAVAAEALLKEGVALDASWTRHTAGGVRVIIADGVAVVLSLELSDDVVAETLALAPRVIVFLEDGFAGRDSVKANAYTGARNLGITMKTV